MLNSNESFAVVFGVLFDYHFSIDISYTSNFMQNTRVFMFYLEILLVNGTESAPL